MTAKIPYGHHWIDEEDIRAVVDVLRSDWITTGPMVDRFEEAVSRFVGAKSAVAVSSGTAALHTAVYAAGIGPGDEVIVPSLTFVATANAVVFQGGTPVFADVEEDTLLLDPEDVVERITGRTKAIMTVDYAGQPCDYDRFRALADKHELTLIADACHAFGAEYRGKRVGSLADLTAFSFHPVKHITTGEGGMVVTQDADYAERMRRFRNHGIDRNSHSRVKRGTWYYEMTDLGYNYRITDFQCALGLSQLRKLPSWLALRRAVADSYTNAFADIRTIRPLAVSPRVRHAYHLYVVRVNSRDPRNDRNAVFAALQEQGIAANVHYIPAHLHPFYRRRFRTGPGQCPVAEAAYQEILSLPIFPRMEDRDVEGVIAAVRKAVGTA
jgi:perosamine synthetase